MVLVSEESEKWSQDIRTRRTFDVGPFSASISPTKISSSRHSRAAIIERDEKGGQERARKREKEKVGDVLSRNTIDFNRAERKRCAAETGFPAGVRENGTVRWHRARRKG